MGLACGASLFHDHTNACSTLGDLAYAEPEEIRYSYRLLGLTPHPSASVSF
jgi:hypothetical protein